ncbi:hypothetical protein [Mucilaginibacter sp.]|uniref:hypothetical protein n=1 Tax=Mucilaginibacter sp. TaxID=1882438 RepID=UPI0035623A88
MESFKLLLYKSITFYFDVTLLNNNYFVQKVFDNHQLNNLYERDVFFDYGNVTMKAYHSICLIILCLAACKQPDKTRIVKKPVQISKSTPVIVTNDNIYSTVINFPKDTNYIAEVLTTEGVAHNEEVDPQLADHEWMGIFKSDSGYYISDTKIKISHAHDEIVDEKEIEKTGWRVESQIKDSAVLLISNLNYLKPRPIKSFRFGKNFVLPGYSNTFNYNDVSYTLYATGQQLRNSKPEEIYNISHYKLYIKATIEGKSYNQLLVYIDGFDDAMVDIIFAGDIDGDSRPDFIINTTNDYNLIRPTLYLSKPAEKNQLLKVVGLHNYVGC